MNQRPLIDCRLRTVILAGHRSRFLVGLLTILTFGTYVSLNAEETVPLKNGLTETGTIFQLPSLNENAFAAAGGGVKAQPIIMVDDGIRRVYMHRRGMVNGDPKPARGIERTITFEIKAPLNGKAVAALGPLLGVSPFNEFGRRAVVVPIAGERTSILQGITELTSRYAKVEALKDRPSYIWDMRVATSSLDSQTLRSILARRLDRPNMPSDQILDMRLEHVRFFLEAERFNDAREELRETIKQFPNEPNLDAMLIRITEREAKRLIDEVEQRASVGQERFARNVLSTFKPQKVGRIVRLQVSDVVAKLDAGQKSVDDAVTKLEAQAGQINPAQAKAIQGILKEIQDSISPVTLPRLSDYLLQADNANISLDSRVALGVSGWLLGKGNGIQNLSVATSMIQVRDLVREYLGSDDPARRKGILTELANLEGAEPEYVDRMLPLLLPPKSLPDESKHPEINGMYTIGLNAPHDAAVQQPRYVVQLPPDYNPLREYPCILALHPPQGTPEQQLQWWAGPYDNGLGFRNGHATRHGYIVVAPAWTRTGQRVYEYTPREHQRVLIALRDAMRRTSINADKIFIVGHGEGATAAWDIAVSHPDIWAGMIAISSDPGKTIVHYSPNAELVPIYIVNGFLDQVRSKNNHAFTAILDDYANVRADAMFVMYKGWGFSFFFEEIHNMFRWMNTKSHRRKDIPQVINNVSMREGDTFFWWLEMDGMKDGTAINPILWEQAKRIRGKKVEATIGADNSIRVSNGPTERFFIWMRPGMGIDLNKQVIVRSGSSSRAPLRYNFEGSLKVMLEDARQRADRKRPFWARVSVP